MFASGDGAEGDAAPGSPALVRGFVSGALLNTWCTRSEPRDIEACFSYLRGVFDVLNSLDAAGVGAPASSIVDCVPDRVSITELRTVLVRHASRHPENLGLQASLLVRKALAENYECR